MEENMAKTNELKARTQDHFEAKVDRKLEPAIEREELKLKAQVNEILDKGITSFSKKIGADKVISRLKKAEEEKRQASRLAFMFFNDKALEKKNFNKSLIYNLEGKNRQESISVKDCEEQINKWAEAQAKQIAENSPEGKKLSYLKALREKAKDLVAEASVPTELATSLDNLFKFVGLSWSNKLPALPPANESKRSNKSA
tara:strand:+ start:357 stop:956 length:600 start_codon:yes stop_codon:yes gene_type:complete